LGRTSEGGSSPTRLQEVDVPLVSDATCRQAGGNYTTVGEMAFCAGIPQGGIDSCQGDSGGPIVINRGGAITQLGVVSWGIGCA
ncbi:trypsin-like serine protease, partial [Escherichia coli]|nr:trypsin-like serine protease [Escherichia coli]